MPSLIRFVVTVGALIGLIYLGMLALVANVKVEPREITQIVTIPKTPQ
ncbi:MAG: oxidoreductase [Bradyrhizobium sp.]|nr:MAG: oxidoreductase [Bradyrhizobium sp.]